MPNMVLSRAQFRLARNRNADRSESAHQSLRELLDPAFTAAVRSEIRSWPGYAATPLVDLTGVARAVGVAKIWYKDEGRRFGVGSFKPLGGGYAVARIAARHVMRTTGLDRLSSVELLSDRYREIASQTTVTCATDGNHGRAVAWAAHKFGCRAVVYMASIVSPLREQAIQSFGAGTIRSQGTHEDAARESREVAQQNGWFVVSETENATEPQIAFDTLAGYTTLLDEIASQLPDDRPPTHMFVQAGVGGLAATAACYGAARWGTARPVLVVVEALNADCILRSLERGKPVAVGGELDTIMAGLAAGETSGYAWRSLRVGAGFGMSIPDGAAVETMRLLADAPYGDQPVVAGESGVAGLAATLLATQDENSRELVGLDETSRIVTIGTEGATDPAVYERLVGRPPGVP